MSKCITSARVPKGSLLYLLKSVLSAFTGGLGSEGGTGIECEVLEPCISPLSCIPVDYNYYCIKKRFTPAAANGQPGTPGMDGKS